MLPREFFTDFFRAAQDEGHHFSLLATRLKGLDSFYGALPAHDGLWDSASATSKDLLAHLAIEHCVNEARGLDVVPTNISHLRNGGDNETAELLDLPHNLTIRGLHIRPYRMLKKWVGEMGFCGS